MRLIRRFSGLLAVIVVALFPIILVASSIAFINNSAPSPSGPPLRQLADKLGIHIGSAVGYAELTSDTQYAQILGQQFSAITPENEMKWVSVEATQGVYDFSQADAEVRFAQQHNQLVRGHNLVWYQQLPSWLTGGTFTSAQLASILQQHITTEVTHFKGEIWQWDVVNEPFNDSDGTLRDTLWLQALGPDYIADSLRWAHAADPNAKLFINDFNIEGINSKSDGMYALVKNLLAQHVPIDGVGFETHLDLQFGVPSQIKENMQRFAALGLDVDITEMDVRLPLPATSDELTAQANVYSQLMQDCIAVPRCVDFTIWEYTDKYSWVPQYFPNEGAPDIYDDNLAPKPAAAALIQALQQPVSQQVHGS